jgi:hypothetical protein
MNFFEVPFRWVIYIAVAMAIFCRVWLFPHWDRQMEEQFKNTRDTLHSQNERMVAGSVKANEESKP